MDLTDVRSIINNDQKRNDDLEIAELNADVAVDELFSLNSPFSDLVRRQTL